ncbi:MAG: protein-L-isoaspartate O-methyltransferase [Chloroflexi bacterium OLB13]|nr:MAG: protein-L-isoaspartate O-methyltransferase [Chloroflexi bacterium OLB13]
MRGIKPDTAALIKQLENSGVLHDARIRAAFKTVSRANFLPDLDPDEVYADRAVIIKRDPAGTAISSSSQPTMMAQMLNQLMLKPGMNVLEVGAGSGYNAALMKELVGAEGRVTSLELDQDIAERARENLARSGYGSVQVVTSDGASGYAPRAAYDRIICTATVWDVPQAWVRQLKPRGRLVTPIQVHAGQVSAAFDVLKDGTLYSAENLPCRFVLMRGASAVPNFVRQVASSALVMWSLDADEIDGASLHLLLSADQEINFLSQPLTSEQIWSGVMPYTMLNAPDDIVLATYFISEGQQAYGMDAGGGYAVLSPASAAFVPYQGGGKCHTFAGADAFLVAQDMLDRWHAIGEPGAEQLRVRLIPLGMPIPDAPNHGCNLTRQDHALQVWLEPVGEETNHDILDG